MILADSSIWIDHLRQHDERLATLIEQRQVLMHSLILGELACGSLGKRDWLLWRWQRMAQLESVSDSAALTFVERHSLMSKGIGFIDVHLLAATAAKAGTRLWTRDQRLAGIARKLGLAFSAHDA